MTNRKIHCKKIRKNTKIVLSVCFAVSVFLLIMAFSEKDNLTKFLVLLFVNVIPKSILTTFRHIHDINYILYFFSRKITEILLASLTPVIFSYF